MCFALILHGFQAQQFCQGFVQLILKRFFFFIKVTTNRKREASQAHGKETYLDAHNGI